jgi:hypothetical protein
VTSSVEVEVDSLDLSFPLDFFVEVAFDVEVEFEDPSLVPLDFLDDILQACTSKMLAMAR